MGSFAKTDEPSSHSLISSCALSPCETYPSRRKRLKEKRRSWSHLRDDGEHQFHEAEEKSGREGRVEETRGEGQGVVSSPDAIFLEAENIVDHRIVVVSGAEQHTTP